MSWQPANADDHRTLVRRPDDCAQCGQPLMQRGDEVRCSGCGLPAASLYRGQEEPPAPAPEPGRKPAKKKRGG